MSAVPSPHESLASSKGRVPIAIAVAATILGALNTQGGADAWHWLHWVGKPLATALILGRVWQVAWPVSVAYRRRVLSGMAFCLLGDVLLMLLQELFIPGLLSFLLAHICFIVAFSGEVRFAVRWPAWLACLAVGAGMGLVLWPTMAPALRAPVLVYIGVLATMAGQTLGRAWWLTTRGDSQAASARRAGIGAVLFMASDGLLAWDRFRAALPWAALYVLTTYYAALWLLARSVERSARATSEAQGIR